MPCIDGSGQMTEMAGTMLAALENGATLTELAQKTGLALYRVRSGVRELTEAGLVETQNETCILTETGRAALARVPGRA
jgi:DNA-binding IclR family transcriptional regulator